MRDRLFILSQHLLPHHLLSRLAGSLANCTWSWVKNPFINWFVNRYQVDMSQAAEPNPTAYACFNDFFTRALRPDARPLDPDQNSILCPADGVISQMGSITHGRVIQAKGQSFSVLELLGGNSAHASQFQGGQFATVYLSPSDYHRVHMPLTGTLREMIHVPGKLFSVNQTTAANVPELFARNERVVCLFDTEAGPMALVLVGAMIVASIETVWAGPIAPPQRLVRSQQYGISAPQLERGAEMGRFKLGSTAILLLSPGRARWNGQLSAGSLVRMGQKLGEQLDTGA